MGYFCKNFWDGRAQRKTFSKNLGEVYGVIIRIQRGSVNFLKTQQLYFCRNCSACI